jgi:hypothetical protein
MTGKQRNARGRFALCLETAGCEDLVWRKVYEVLPDRKAAVEGLLRIIDESGEDYLYPADQFVLVALPAVARRAWPTEGAAALKAA